MTLQRELGGFECWHGVNLSFIVVAIYMYSVDMDMGWT